MFSDLEVQDLKEWGIILVFLYENFCKVSSSAFLLAPVFWFPLARVEQTHVLISTLTDIPLSGIFQTAWMVLVLGGVAMRFRFLTQTMGKQGGKTLSCFCLAPEWSSTWERVKMSLWPCYKCGENVYLRHVPAGSKAQVFCRDGELFVASTTFCLLERHGHTEGSEGVVKMPTL